jgi:nitrite reductase/ring-hydroxylating ferredoxin subunit
VRQLAHEFRTRIELKQVGARDEARLIGDAGHCGLTLCCRNHLKELGGITMDMAKIQKHTADPSKITGRCGKLLCCLRYEYSAYKEARELLPSRGTRLETKKGTGFVVEQNMLLREVVIEIAGGDRILVKLEEIEGAPAPVAGCSGCPTPAPSVAPKVEEPLKTDTATFERLATDTKTEIPVVVEATGEVRAPSAPSEGGATGAKPAATPAPPVAAPRPPGRPAQGPPPPRPQQPHASAPPGGGAPAGRPALKPPPKAPPPPKRDMWVAALPTAEVPPGTSKVADLGGRKVAVFNVDGVYHVISNECGHQGGPLGEGKLEGFSVTCPWHQWKFDVTTGHCLSVSGSSVRRFESAILGADLYVKV